MECYGSVECVRVGGGCSVRYTMNGLPMTVYVVPLIPVCIHRLYLCLSVVISSFKSFPSWITGGCFIV